MLGGCSLGSIFANLCGGTYEQKCLSGEKLLSAVAPQSERLADKCRWDVRAWDVYACRAPGNDGRQSRVLWVLM